MPKETSDNKLFYGDNLPILREHIAAESIDLIYLDPPFNSNRSYNVLFKEETGKESDAQVAAFEDTWHWNATAETTYEQLIAQAPERVAAMIGAVRQFIGANQMMAYLVMMAARLVELHRVLKPTGSLYLHCDPTASHYLKIVLDTIFDPRNFRNEIIWKRAETVKGNFGQGSKLFGNNTDSILFYSKLSDYTFNAQFSGYSEDYIDQFYKFVDPETGRKYQLISMTGPGGAAKGNPQYKVMGVTRFWRYSKEKMQQLIDAGLVVQTSPGPFPRRKMYLDEGKGVAIQSLWDDMPGLHSQAAERLGYPTQKPLALLERIIIASSNEGDIVLDPFCGCGTAIAAAQKLGRRWIGIDITHLAIALQKHRLRDMFDLNPGSDYQVIGEPEDLGSARQLANENRYQFQWWALSLIQARPIGGASAGREGKKGSDSGIDGVILFIDDASEKPKRALVQVKSGHVKSGDIRDLRGAVEREQAALGIFVTLEPASSPMLKEALTAGSYHSPGWQRDYSMIQIYTVEELLQGKKVEMPPTRGTFKQAGKAQQSTSEQPRLELK